MERCHPCGKAHIIVSGTSAAKPCGAREAIVYTRGKHRQPPFRCKNEARSTSMVTYIATVWAKPGHEEQVTKFYRDLEPLMRQADGYRGRQILRARSGTMAAAVRKVVTPEEAARHAEQEHAGTHFVLVEQWDSVEQRIAFSRGAAAGRSRELFPHILPEHSHEFYEDVTP
jgi:quinol monooxygenase YgiN